MLGCAENDFIEEYCHYRLGKDYLYGVGTNQNYEKAMVHFLQSDNQYSWYSLGQMYQRGLGTNKNEEIAFEYFLKSAEASNPFALYETARCYELGTGCLKDKGTAEYYYKNAYLKFESMVKVNEDDNLLYRLGMMNIKGKGVEQNIDLGIHFLEKAVELDNASAKIQLAKLYLDNDDFEHIAKALEWLHETDRGNAYFILGREYMKGVHIEKDIAQAIHYFQKCESNEYAYYYLYKLFEELNDDEQSIHYLQKAVDMNNEVAQVQMARLLIDGIKIDKNIDQAVSLLMKAEEKNNPFAQYILGKLFLFGNEVEQDKKLALTYLEKSAKQGNIYAQYLIDHMGQYQQQNLAMMTARFFHHISRIFEQQLPVNTNNPLAHVDKKLNQKIRMKKQALGQRNDDHTQHF
ncbi:tetratricopeptide repeat protein [Thomasclavelia cocleata]|uniref:tetratricopeptide repeat protein n=1 Tax=Thomasclavelia cocleata TaxID=69824 RepID=UPI003306BD42